MLTVSLNYYCFLLKVDVPCRSNNSALTLGINLLVPLSPPPTWALHRLKLKVCFLCENFGKESLLFLFLMRRHFSMIVGASRAEHKHCFFVFSIGKMLEPTTTGKHSSFILQGRNDIVNSVGKIYC